jgi:hypothetical protein
LLRAQIQYCGDGEARDGHYTLAAAGSGSPSAV